MPTYAYRCAACGHDFEQYQSFTDDTLTECPSCGEPQLRKVFNSIGVTFNGSGFYRTDSRGGTSASEGAGKTDASSKPSAKSDASGAKTSDAASSSSSGTPKSSPATPAKS